MFSMFRDLLSRNITLTSEIWTSTWQAFLVTFGETQIFYEATCQRDLQVLIIRLIFWYAPTNPSTKSKNCDHIEDSLNRINGIIFSLRPTKLH